MMSRPVLALLSSTMLPALCLLSASSGQAQQAWIEKDMITIKEVELDHPAENNQLWPALVSDDPSGGFWVAWYVKGDGYRVQHFSDEMTKDREELAFNERAIMGLYGHEDGSLAFTWFPQHMNRIFGVDLYLSKISAKGEEVFKTKVRGDEGANLEYEKRPVGFWNHPDYQGPVVPIAYNGRQYGLFYVVLQKFPDLACHTGDEFVAVHKDGRVDESSRKTWNASHSFWQSCVTLPRRREFYGITIPDPWPYSAVRISKFSGERNPEHHVLWPKQPTKGFPPGTKISAAFNAPRGFAMAMSTAIPKVMENVKDYTQAEFDKAVAEQGKGEFPVLLTFDESGRKAKATYITDTPVEDTFTTGARLGKEHIVVMWANGQGDKGTVFGAYPTKMALLDRKGEVLQSPIHIDAPLTWHSDATTLSNGDVIWASIADDHTPVDDPRKLYLVRVRGDLEQPVIVKAPTHWQMSEENLALLKKDHLMALVKLSEDGTLRRVPMRMSFTRERVWLSKADPAGSLTFQLVDGEKTAVVPFAEVPIRDVASLAQLVAGYKPKSMDAQAMAAVYLEHVGLSDVAKRYVAKSSLESVEKFKELLDVAPNADGGR